MSRSFKFCRDSGGRSLSSLLCLLAACGGVAAQVPPTRELVEMSLDELATIEITSVSKKAERLADAPASVFVITSEDILGVAGSVLAILNIGSCCCVLGLPVGIWSLTVLMSPDIITMYSANLPDQQHA